MQFKGTVIDYESSFPQHSMLFEWCDGQSILEFLNESNGQPRYIIPWSINLLTGLKALHDNDILHGDIAARNVMFKTQEGENGVKYKIGKGLNLYQFCT